MENLLNNDFQSLEILNEEDLLEINAGLGSGNIFQDIGWVAGRAVYYYCKGASLMYG